jgi:hypothetical protein
MLNKTVLLNKGINVKLLLPSGVRGDTAGRGTALQAGRSQVRFPMVSLEFFIDLTLPAPLRP